MRLTCFLAVLLATAAVAQTNDDEKAEPGFNEDTFKGLTLRNIGPAFMSGRIADIAVDPTDRSTWYERVRIAAGAGRVSRATCPSGTSCGASCRTTSSRSS